MINFLNMKYFLVVAEEKSFSIAANRLYISQQTLSAHISQIEKEIGAPLFERTRPLTITPVGERFLRGVKDLLFINTQLDRDLKDMVDSFSGVLRIGISHAYSRAFLPGLLDKFNAACPTATVQIHESDYDQMNEALMSGTVDLIITRPGNYSPKVNIVSLWPSDDVYLYITQKYLQRAYRDRAGQISVALSRGSGLHAVEDGEFILPRQGNVRANVEKIFRTQEIIPHIYTEVSAMETAIALCREGLGITVAPGILLKAYAGHDISLSAPPCYMLLKDCEDLGLGICYRDNESPSRLMQIFIDIARQNYRTTP